MNGIQTKIYVSLLCILFFVSFSACRTVGRDMVLDPGSGARETRANISAVSEGQADIAITGEQIAGQSNAIAEDLDDLERAIISGTDADQDLERILRAIRSRKLENYDFKTKRNKPPD
jgi:hypothetical protein